MQRGLDALSPTERRALGAWLTPVPLARLMARLLQPGLSRTQHPCIVDPAAGTGRLLQAMRDALSLGALDSTLVGVEKHPALAATAAEALDGFGRVVAADALDLLAPNRRLALLGVSEVDAVVANPPYVREKHHREVFAEVARREPRWARFCAPRTDLQQLFLVLGAELLAPGGELVYLVNSYWLHSDSGLAVRDHLAASLDFLALVDFGSTRLFDDAPGQHNLLVHARRKGGAPPPATTRFVRVTGRGPSDLGALSELLEGALLDRPGAGASAAPADPGGLDVTDAPGLVTAGPRRRWYLPSRRDRALADLEAAAIPLGELFQTHQGVVSGADVLTARNARHLADPPPVGTGIFVLTAAEVAALGLSARERALLRPVYRGRDVAPYRVDTAEPTFVLYLHGGTSLDGCPRVLAHLERFRPLLERRRECRLGIMPWWRLHWPRAPELFARPRLVTPRRAPSPRFALAPDGFCEQSDLALVTSPDDDAPRLRALLAVLNSAVMAAWCRARGKHKGAIREFFGRPLEELPLPAAARDDPPAFAHLATLAAPEHAARAEVLVRDLYGEAARALRAGD